PVEVRQRRPDLRRHMAGGRHNPMRARAIYLGSSLYRIHGSNDPDKIGQAVSSGCIRMTNQDVIDLYSRVQIGATVIVQKQRRGRTTYERSDPAPILRRVVFRAA